MMIEVPAPNAALERRKLFRCTNKTGHFAEATSVPSKYTTEMGGGVTENLLRILDAFFEA